MTVFLASGWRSRGVGFVALLTCIRVVVIVLFREQIRQSAVIFIFHMAYSRDLQ